MFTCICFSNPIEYACTNSSGKRLNAASNGLVKNKLGFIPFLYIALAIKYCKLCLDKMERPKEKINDFSSDEVLKKLDEGEACSVVGKNNAWP